MPSILFVCTANQFRSPLAGAMLLKNIERENMDGKWVVESAGTWAGTGIPALRIALQIAQQLGLSGLDSHRSRSIDQKLLGQFDLIIVMENGQKEGIYSEFPAAGNRLYLLSEIAEGISYDIPDPADNNTNPHQIASELHTLITSGTEKILQLALSHHKSQSQ